MDIIGTYLLAFFAAIATFQTIVNPIKHTTDFMQGTTQGQRTLEMQQQIRSNPLGCLRGCLTILMSLVFAVFMFSVVYPIAVVAAISKDIGYQPFAYGTAAIAILWWAILVVGLQSTRKKAQQAQQAAIVLSQGGSPIEQEITQRSKLHTNLRRYFFALPTVYLWYLFVVNLNI